MKNFYKLSRNLLFFSLFNKFSIKKLMGIW